MIEHVRAIRFALSGPVEPIYRQCIGCKPIIEALVLIRDLERKLTGERDSATTRKSAMLNRTRTTCLP
ncbi:MAG: hypothetical protein HYX46_00055 [Betaproteobacteria bacterium]|nr:hypothetical protein [Betaproteobacteria bacterium]